MVRRDGMGRDSRSRGPGRAWLSGFEEFADVLEQHEEMEWIGRGGQKVELLVVAPGGLVLGVNCKCADAGKIGGLHGSQYSVLEQRASDPLLLPILMYRQAGEQHDRDRMACQPFPQAFRSIGIFDLTDREAVVADDRAIDQAQVSLCCVRSLVLQGVLSEPSIQLRLSAIERVERMIAAQLFYGPRLVQRVLRLVGRVGAASKKPGSCRSERNRGRGRTGALSAA